MLERESARKQSTSDWQPTKTVNALAPYFPPFTHFVIIYRENHTFDDYLGDCATTVHAGCNGKVMSPNHISSGPGPAQAGQDLRLERLLQHRDPAPERAEPLVALLGPVRIELAAAVLPDGARHAVRPFPRR